MNKKFKYGLLAITLAGITLQSCKKEYLDTAPSDSVTNQIIFESTENGYIALNGIHTLMLTADLAGTTHRDFGMKNADLSADLMGNDMVSISAGGYDWFIAYYNYDAPAEVSNEAYNMWLFHYRIINNANAIINGIDEATGSDADKKDLKGQALAYRAWAYHRLVTRFSMPYFTDATLTGNNGSAMGVPIYTVSSGGESKGNPRGTINDVVLRMTEDINQAIAYLEDGATVHTEKSHINAFVAHGIAARIAMYKGKWSEAYNHANTAKAAGSLMTAPADYGGGMNDKGLGEFIWCSTFTETQYNDLGIRSWISFFDISAPGYAGLTAVERRITIDLYNQLAPTDKRKVWWFGASPAAKKYMVKKFRTKDPEGFSCDLTYMRVAEMYLIASEAAARNGDAGTARTILQEFLSTRHTAAVTAPTTAADIIDRVLWERRVELWGEGFSQIDLKERFLPLNRLIGASNHNLTECEVATLPAGDNLFTFKIPQAELNANPNINAEHQNP